MLWDDSKLVWFEGKHCLAMKYHVLLGIFFGLIVARQNRFSSLAEGTIPWWMSLVRRRIPEQSSPWKWSKQLGARVVAAVKHTKYIELCKLHGARFFFCSCHRIISTASSPYTIHCIMSNHLQLNDAQRWGEESGSSQSSWNKVIAESQGDPNGAASTHGRSIAYCTCTWRSQKSQYNDCWWAKWSKIAETWFFGMTLVNLWKQWNRLRVCSWSKTWVVTDVQPWMPWISNMFSNWGGRWWTYLKFIHGFLTSPKASSCEETWSVFSKPAPIGPDKRVHNHREFPCPLLKPTERLGLLGG